MKRIYFLLFFLAFSGMSMAQSNTNMEILENDNNTSIPPITWNPFFYDDLVPELAAPDVHLFNITMDSLSAMIPMGYPLYYGKFVFINGANDIGIDSGFALSSGVVPDIANPPSHPIPSFNSGIPWPAMYHSGAYYPGGWSTNVFGYPWQWHQYPELVALNNGDSIADANILEFDFVPEGPVISLQYVFASEEYPNLNNPNYPSRLCDTPNDVMGIFLSGPGISGEQNIALIPGTNIPVGINTITPSGMSCNPENATNSRYYVDNTGGRM